MRRLICHCLTPSGLFYRGRVDVLEMDNAFLPKFAATGAIRTLTEEDFLLDAYHPVAQTAVQ